MLNKWLIKPLHYFEDGLLLLMVAGLIIICLAQIVLRNIGVNGLAWMDTATRISVLWLAMLGALRASREQKHIVIDVVSHYANAWMRKVVFFIVSIASAVLCFILAYYSAIYLQGEIQYGGYAFLIQHGAYSLKVPVWMCEAIIPVTLALIALRSLIYCFNPPDLHSDNA